MHLPTKWFVALHDLANPRSSPAPLRSSLLSARLRGQFCSTMPPEFPSGTFVRDFRRILFMCLTNLAFEIFARHRH
jgi:hypothetical protein